MGTLWEGRLSGETTDALKALNDSLEIDKRLYKEDILGYFVSKDYYNSQDLIQFYSHSITLMNRYKNIINAIEKDLREILVLIASEIS